MEEVFGLWTEIPTWLQYLVSIILIGIGVALFFAGARRGPIALFAIGIVLFCFSGPSDSQKNGYNF